MSCWVLYSVQYSRSSKMFFHLTEFRYTLKNQSSPPTNVRILSTWIFPVPPPFFISLFGLFLLGLRLAWVRVCHFVLFWIFTPSDPQSTPRGNWKNRVSFSWILCRSNFLLGWPHRRFCHGPKVSPRDARGGSLSHANSNANSFEFGFLADHREKANWQSYSKVWARF